MVSPTYPSLAPDLQPSTSAHAAQVQLPSVSPGTGIQNTRVIWRRFIAQTLRDPRAAFSMVAHRGIESNQIEMSALGVLCTIGRV